MLNYALAATRLGGGVGFGGDWLARQRTTVNVGATSSGVWLDLPTREALTLL
jgi:hypothetical protein